MTEGAYDGWLCIETGEGDTWDIMSPPPYTPTAVGASKGLGSIGPNSRSVGCGPEPAAGPIWNEDERLRARCWTSGVSLSLSDVGSSPSSLPSVVPSDPRELRATVGSAGEAGEVDQVRLKGCKQTDDYIMNASLHHSHACMWACHRRVHAQVVDTLCRSAKGRKIVLIV